MSERVRGCFSQTASGHTSYEIFEASSGVIEPVCRLLVDVFSFSPPDDMSVGVDVFVCTCRKDGVKLAIGWDTWSGFFISAQSDLGDALVRQIGLYLDTVIHQEAFEKYIRVS